MCSVKSKLKFLLFFLLTALALFSLSSCGKEKVTSDGSIKYLTEEDYLSGNFDGKLNSGLTVNVGEKGYIVVDFTLSGIKKVNEDAVANVEIRFSSNTVGANDLEVEEIPTSDYSVSGGTVSASFKIYDSEKGENSFRFIVSVSRQSAAKVAVQAVISIPNGGITLNGQTAFWGEVTVKDRPAVESKLNYELSLDGTYYVLTGLGGENGDTVKIPDKYKELPVKEIADRVFSDVIYLKEIALPSVLTKIGAGAFKNCAALESIYIPESVSEIGEGAFAGCPDIHLCCEAGEKPSGWSESVTADVKSVTFNCNKYFTFTLSSDEKSYILDSAYGVTGSVVIPDSYKGLPVTVIKRNAFMDCTELTGVEIPYGVTNIEAYAFSGCNKLESVNIPDSVKSIENNAFENCDSLISITLGSGVKSLMNSAFEDCDSLTSIVIPAGLITVGYDVFKDCERLTSIKFKGSSEQWNAIIKQDGWDSGTGSYTLSYNFEGE